MCFHTYIYIYTDVYIYMYIYREKGGAFIRAFRVVPLAQQQVSLCLVLGGGWWVVGGGWGV